MGTVCEYSQDDACELKKEAEIIAQIEERIYPKTVQFKVAIHMQEKHTVNNEWYTYLQPFRDLTEMYCFHP